jgi:dUTP pyrophosphatase
LTQLILTEPITGSGKKIVQGIINAGSAGKRACKNAADRFRFSYPDLTGFGGGLKKVSLKILKTHPRIILPQYKSEGASGMDLRAFLDSEVIIPALGRVKIPTGLKIELPAGYEAQVRPRSGLAIKSGITVLNSPGTIDSDYRGEIEIILINLGDKEFVVKDGQRIAQLVIAPLCRARIEEVSVLEKSSRDGGGFGSTGV